LFAKIKTNLKCFECHKKLMNSLPVSIKSYEAYFYFAVMCETYLSYIAYSLYFLSNGICIF